MWTSFLDELEKMAVVSKPVKDYRRMRAAFEEASRSAQGSNLVMSKGMAMHGTGVPSDLTGILREGKILPSLGEEVAQHGPGVYWWKGFPREEYLQTQFDEGVLSKLESLPGKQPLRRNIRSGHVSPHQVVTGPREYLLGSNREKALKALEEAGEKIRPGVLPPADTAIMDIGSRAKKDPKALRALLADAAEHRMRVVDSAIFQRARAQARAANMGKLLPGPSKLELLKLYARRLTGH